MVMGLRSLLPATWWIGSPALLPFTLIIGFLVVRKLRRFTLVASFGVVALIIITVIGMVHGSAPNSALGSAFTSWPLVFFGTIMLTEPSTTPPRLWSQVAYGILVGGLFGS